MQDGDAAGLTDKERLEQEKWQWHQLGHMQVCTSFQTDNHTSTPPLSFLHAGCPFCRPTNSVKALKAMSRRKRTRKKITRVTPSKPITLMP